jgi:hypothetical protein
MRTSNRDLKYTRLTKFRTLAQKCFIYKNAMRFDILHAFIRYYAVHCFVINYKLKSFLSICIIF